MKKVVLSVLVILVLSMGMVAGLASAAEPTYHTIVAGDTLRKLAAKYETSVVEFLDFNPGITPDNLKVGQKLLVPVQTLWSYHVVQQGDNAQALATWYKVPLETLRSANGLTNNKLNVGETIRVPMHFYLGEAKQLTHTVEIGDTLFKLAQQYKVTLAQLVEWNKIVDMNNIIAGQTLIVG